MNAGAGGDSGPVGLGIDIGTSTIAFAARDARGPIATLTLPNDAALPAEAGRAEQDPRRILDTVRRGVAELARSIGLPIDSLACTGQMHGLLLVDETLDPLTPLISWQDRRAASLAAELDAALEREDPGSSSRRGCRLHPGYGATTLAWLCSRGCPGGARWAATISDWVAARLCGRLATDPSNAASWGIYSLDRKNWDLEAVRRLRIPETLLPPITQCGAPLGTTEAANIGSAPLVCCGVGDNQASVLAATWDLDAQECVVANVGTGSQVSVIAAAAADLSAALVSGLEVRPFIGDRVLAVGASLSGGAAYALLGRFVAATRGLGSKELQQDVYASMDRWAAAAPPGCDGLECDPAFFGERGAERLTGCFRGITDANFTPAHLCRAVLEGMARRLRDLYLATGLRRSRLVGSGNAVRKSAVFREILAQVFGMPLVVSAHVEEAAAGAAIVCRRGGRVMQTPG